MALAIRCEKLINDGVVADQSELARYGQITTARMTQIMSLLNLAPDLQEQILFLPRTERGRDIVKETDIRVLAATLNWRKQRRPWAALQRRIEGDDAGSRQVESASRSASRTGGDHNLSRLKIASGIAQITHMISRQIPGV
jgi:hypothetical protein